MAERDVRAIRRSPRETSRLRSSFAALVSTPGNLIANISNKVRSASFDSDLCRFSLVQLAAVDQHNEAFHGTHLECERIQSASRKRYVT